MLKLFESTESFLRARGEQPEWFSEIAVQVAEIVKRVREEGDRALKYFTQRFDGVTLENLRVPEEEIGSALNDIGTETKEIFLAAIESVRNFHLKQRPQTWVEIEKDGSQFGMQFTSVESVGVYVPGGTAGYPSTVIMTVVPAQIADVKQIILVSPPQKNGSVNTLVLAAAGLLGIKEIYSIGGVQAIAALAYGTESIPKVSKIVGPGNAFVNEAKRQVFGVVGIDALAGPTEIVLLADEEARPEYCVRDLIAQAEHDADARAILITTSKSLAKKVQSLLESVLPQCERKEIVMKALTNFGAIVLISDLNEGVQLVNEIAPEHLQIMTKNPSNVLRNIRNAGAIFLGDFSPVVIGDYFAGSNHVLPTGANAKFSSPLGVWDFMKFSSVISYSKVRFKKEALQISQFSKLEGFINHSIAIECRNE